MMSPWVSQSVPLFCHAVLLRVAWLATGDHALACRTCWPVCATRLLALNCSSMASNALGKRRSPVSSTWVMTSSAILGSMPRTCPISWIKTVSRSSLPCAGLSAVASMPRVALCTNSLCSCGVESINQPQPAPVRSRVTWAPSVMAATRSPRSPIWNWIWSRTWADAPASSQYWRAAGISDSRLLADNGSAGYAVSSGVSLTN